jgi:HD-like signal output (HDOD) protein
MTSQATRAHSAPATPPAIAPPTDRKADAAAYAFLTQLADELTHKPLNLPCFPDIVPRIRKALTDPKSTSDDVVRIAGTEPRLAARRLQTANSAVFNPSGVPFSELRQAVTRLGHHLIQSVTMAFALQQIKAEPSLKSVAKQLHVLWEKSMAAASICQVLAQKLKVPADKVFLTGLLHGIGYFYIMVRAAEASSAMKVEELQTEFVAERHPIIGRAVMQKWGFEPVMCEAVGRQNDYAHKSKRRADITDVLIVSVLLADALIERNGDLARCAGVNSFAAVGLTPNEIEAILRHTAHSLDSLRDALER